jgi:hypothetical protein
MCSTHQCDNAHATKRFLVKLHMLHTISSEVASVALASTCTSSTATSLRTRTAPARIYISVPTYTARPINQITNESQPGDTANRAQRSSQALQVNHKSRVEIHPHAYVHARSTPDRHTTAAVARTPRRAAASCYSTAATAARGPGACPPFAGAPTAPEACTAPRLRTPPACLPARTRARTRVSQFYELLNALG